MSYEESYVKAFPFDKMIPGMLDPAMIEDTVKIVNEAIKDKVQVNLIIHNRAGGNAPPDHLEYHCGSQFINTAGGLQFC